jgi:hypothetical protein
MEEFYPNEKFDYSFFDRPLQTYAKEQKTAGIVNLAMIIAILFPVWASLAWQLSPPSSAQRDRHCKVQERAYRE